MSEGGAREAAAEDRAAARFLHWWREASSGESPVSLEAYLEARPDQARFGARLEVEVVSLAQGAAREGALRMRIGRFEVLRELGRGGQGVVYLARDPDLSRHVALKVLHPGSLAARARERLKREADVLARIEDPAIATVYEVDLEGPSPYIAMRHVSGRSLQELLELARRGDVPPPDGESAHALGLARRLGSSAPADVEALVRTALALARALARAHGQGVVHRDIKPGNVMVGDAGGPVLVDFGLARADGASDSGLTRSGERPGTPRYMSPEQLAGSSAVGARADVFSLGVTLFEALTLEHPYRLDPLSNPSTIERALSARRPSNARATNRGVPDDLDRILECAVAHDPARRYAHAGLLADDLERFLHGQPVEARPPSALYYGRRFLSRHRPWVLASAVVVAVVLVQRQLNRERLSANERRLESERLELVEAADRRQRRSMLELVQWLSSEIDLGLQTQPLEEGSAEDRVRTGRMLEQLRAVLREQGAEQAGPESPIEDRLLRAALANAEGDFELSLELVDGALVDEAAAAGAEVERTARLLRAHALRKTGDRAGALACSERLIELLEDPSSILVIRGNVLSELGRAPEALASFDRAIELQPDSPWAHAQRGQTRYWAGNPVGAIEDFERAVELEPASAPFRFNLGVVLGNRGRFEEALGQLDQAAALAPDRAPVFVVRARNLFSMGRTDEALADFERAFALEDDPPRDWRLDRARALRGASRWDEALALVEELVRDFPDDADALELRGLLRAQGGLDDEALADLDRSIELAPRASAYNQRGILLGHLERLEEALFDFDRAFELGHRSEALTYNRATLRLELGRAKEALELLEGASGASLLELRERCLETLADG